MERAKSSAMGKLATVALASATAFALSMGTVAANPAAAHAATKAPAKASISKVTSKSAGTATVTVKKVSKAKGYNYKVATNKSFTKCVWTKTSTKKTVTFKGLKEGKKYYAKVRAYKVVKGKKVYGKWSKVKTVTIKKTVAPAPTPTPTPTPDPKPKAGGFDITKAAQGQDSLFNKDAKDVTDEDRAAMLAEAHGQDPYDGNWGSHPEVNKTADVHFTYKNGRNNVTVSMDVLVPKAPAGNKPLVLFIAGGGFTGVNDGGTLDQRMAFAEAGYVVATVQHRVVPQATMPGPLQDIKAAIRFLKAHAADYSIDKNKVAVAGNSAGGYFATMVGVTSNNSTMTVDGNTVDLDIGPNLEESSAVNAVIDLYGVSDLTVIGAGLPETIQNSHKSAATTEAMLLAGAAAGKMGEGVFAESMEGKVAAASPYTYIDKDDPAFLILHGDKDTLVSPVASYDLQKRLEAAGVSVDRYIVKGASHGGAKFAQPEALQVMINFLNANAKQDIPAATEGANDLAAGTKAYEKAPSLADAIKPAEGKELVIDETKADANYSIRETANIVYKAIKSNNTKLHMDILNPTKAADSGAKPCIVYINGGGFTGSSPTGHLQQRWELAKAGYVVASIQHRVVPQGQQPAQLQDCKAAVRYLRANAATYGINPNKIFATGGSAGGYMATMLGVTSNTSSIEVDGKTVLFDEGDNLEYSSAVSCVVDQYGVTDLTIIGACLGAQFESAHHGTSNTEALLVNGSAFGPNAGATVFDSLADGNKAPYYSPFTYIDADDPEFLCLHGTTDTLVSPVSSLELCKRLNAAGVKASMRSLPGTGHGGDNFDSAPVMKDIIDFFNAHR